MALGKRKRQAGSITVVRAAAMIEDGTGRARGWLESAFRMGVSRPAHLLTQRLRSSKCNVGRLLLPYSTGILPLMLRRDEMEAMGYASGLTVRVLDAAGLEYSMFLKAIKDKKEVEGCQLIGPQCRTIIRKNLQNRRPDVVVINVWAFRANTPGWRHRSPDEDPLWYARDLYLVITSTTNDVGPRDEDGAFDCSKNGAATLIRAPPMDSWRGVRPKPRSQRRRRTGDSASTLINDCRRIAAATIAPSSLPSGGCTRAGGERHWVLDSTHGRGPLLLRFIRPKPPAV